MTPRSRIVLWVLAVVGGLGLLALGVTFLLVGLDRADKLASALGIFVGLVGLAVSAVGVLLPSRQRRGPAGQAVSGSTVTGKITQITGGSVGGRRPARQPPPTAPHEFAPQTVEDSSAGSVTQISSPGHVEDDS